ncbi:MAG: histidine--tRNA ligase [Deltaproteobacteria bacterium CG2_30_63_29]|nr:MAG: histidine--tRNA ligase [Deltaproteobacteria bacterium CG2_30_63_29]PIW01089.1 MAG: histidine--tRNA ligase [Deltaproteobacteria bacterium CG17_big_fil_post_rev_8_21_14_2_50_63_7]PJB43917.1 MAG: histidine--tRNA ligase [Deltaproteobacteria bacterium CG_4_9_14_3_um_filter_63_12]
MAVEVSVPKGTRDFLPETLRRREWVIGKIRAIFDAHAFEPLETPALEKLETLSGKYGDEGDKLLFKILKRGAKAGSGECDFGLRYDLTVPLARAVAMHQNELPTVFKRYQIQPVWRADRPGHGRFREFMQCDIDIVGAAGELVEIDLLSAVAEVFEALRFSGVTLHINDRRVLRALIEVSGVALSDEVSAIVAIDKLDKLGEDGVAKELAERGLQPEVAAQLMANLRALGAHTDVLSALDALFVDDPAGREGVESLRRIASGMVHATSGAVTVLVDPSLARGLDYYTGPIFEARAAELAGSLAGGGRYDGLVGMFLGRDIPACGISLGLERILVVMEERGLFEGAPRTSDVMMTCFGPETLERSLEVTRALRSAGLRVDVYPQATKLKKQFKYADAGRIPYVVLIGPDELESGQIQLKELASGEQVIVDLATCIERLRRP